MSKTVSIRTNPRSKSPPTVSELDAFVQSGEPVTPAPRARMKRLTVDVEAGLHKQIRRKCLELDVEMATEIRRILTEHFPA